MEQNTDSSVFDVLSGKKAVEFKIIIDTKSIIILCVCLTLTGLLIGFGIKKINEK